MAMCAYVHRKCDFNRIKGHNFHADCDQSTSEIRSYYRNKRTHCISDLLSSWKKIAQIVIRLNWMKNSPCEKKHFVFPYPVEICSNSWMWIRNIQINKREEASKPSFSCRRFSFSLPFAFFSQKVERKSTEKMWEAQKREKTVKRKKKRLHRNSPRIFIYIPTRKIRKLLNPFTTISSYFFSLMFFFLNQ